ncbi:STAS domain-containing protein [bacterium]|nr:STAS domain-containing protein [bacterium]
MQMRSFWDQDVYVIELAGKLMGGPDSEGFHSQVKEAVQRGGRNVIVDLRGVDWLNSWGVGLLVSAYTTIKNSGGQLALVGCSPKVMTVFKMTRFDSVFIFADSVTGAVSKF